MSPIIPIRCKSAPKRGNQQNPLARQANAIGSKAWSKDRWVAAKLMAVGISADRGFWLRRICLALTLLGLAACSSSDPIEKQSTIAASASQTAVMVVDAWAAGTAPAAYASATLQSTAEILSQAGRQMQSVSSSQGRGVMTAIGQLSAAASRGQAGVDAGNPRQVSQALQDLRKAATDLAAYAKHIAPKS
jgi:hypothetical protein